MLRVIDNISEWTGRIASYLYYPGLIVLVYEVIARYFFNSPTSWAANISQITFAIYFLAGGGYAILHNAMVRMDAIFLRYPVRTKAIIELFAILLMLSVAFVLLWWGSIFFWKSFKLGEVGLSGFKFPVYPAKLFLPVGGAFIVLQGLAEFYRNMIKAFTGRDHGI